ncbi:MAG: DNA replication and repair protein RecF [Verrucomicrobiaceae bacterium]|nr:DNA replication and repair protein RecF [Verrucomicrobiaceae bacterium]
MLSELSVKNFRCFEHARLELHPESTLLIGRNAQGKTSLIEAACVLMRLQSPRTSSKSDFIRFGEKTCVIEGVTNEHRLRFAANVATRRLAVDDAVCGHSADYLANSGLVVWMDHSDMNLLRGGAEHRRRFLDFAGSQVFPDYLDSLRRYDRALRTRNYLLKRDAVVNWRQADAYARVMDALALALTEQRRKLIAWLQPEIAAMHQTLSGGEVARADYAPSVDERGLFEMLLASRAEEERTRSTAAGVHRDDVALCIEERDASSFASEGQQRTLALAMKLAQARVIERAKNQAPVLLIDDIFGELDKTRRRAVLANLPSGSQRLITTTHLDWADDGGACGRVFEVSGGRVEGKWC